MRFAHGLYIALGIALSSGAPRADVSADACAALSELACIQSQDCKLELKGPKAGSGYRCRANANTCESRLIQYQASKDRCEAEASCRFTPANCYCPPDVLCFCGGGPPARCEPLEEGRAG
ncbi:MAG: hypothetical protein ABI411_21515, partial [Tahibacter sp.]